MKNKLGFVLSGGSVRAAAHVGVLKALEEYALEPDLVVGTSGGSIVAALYAAGLNARQLEELFLEYTAAKGRIVDFNWPGAVLSLLTLDISVLPGLCGCVNREDHSAKPSGAAFSELTKCQLLIPAVNLNSGQQTVFCDYRALGLQLDREENSGLSCAG